MILQRENVCTQSFVDILRDIFYYQETVKLKENHVNFFSLDSSFEGINLHESYDAAELLSSLQDQHLDNSWNSSSFAGKQHLQGSHNTPKPLPSAKKFNRVNAAHVSRKPSVSPSVSDSSSRKEHTIVYRFSEQDFSRRPSKGSKKYASPALE